MVKMIEELSVFFPAYNEEKNIKKTTQNTVKVLKKVAKKWEVIIVDDGSRDNTLKVARSLERKDKRIRVINHKVNKGYGSALKTGYENAKYEWVAFIDSDGQFDFKDISKFISKIENADLVLGYRISRADSFMRKLYTKVWSHILPRIIFGLKVKDYSCGFKLIKKEVFENVQPLVGEEKVTQIEMLVKARRAGYKFAEVGVGHYERVHGTQTGASLKVVVKSVVELAKLWWQLR